jgi:hypothetical protein
METGRAFYPVFDSLSRLGEGSIFGVRLSTLTFHTYFLGKKERFR